MAKGEIGTSFVEDVPVIDGWAGFTNKILGLFGRPLITRRAWGVRFDSGRVVLLGVNRSTPQPPSNPPTI